MQGLCPLIQVYDMPTSLRFYRDVLGFEVFSSSPPRSPDDCDWVWLKLSSTELMLNTRYEFDSRPPGARLRPSCGSRRHLPLYRLPDVDAAYRHLRDKGLDVNEPKIAPYGMKQLYLKDPDGFSICFQWPAQK
jgi:glyoxylase I family protein